MTHKPTNPQHMPWIPLSADGNTLGWPVDAIASGIPASLHGTVGGCFIAGIRCRSENLMTLLSALDATTASPTTYIVRDAGWYGRLDDLRACLAPDGPRPPPPSIYVDCRWEYGLHITRARPATVELLCTRPLMWNSLIHTALVRNLAKRGSRCNGRDPILGPWLDQQPVYNATIHQNVQKPKKTQDDNGIPKDVEPRNLPTTGSNDSSSAASGL